MGFCRRSRPALKQGCARISGLDEKSQLSKDGFYTSSPAVWITKPTAILYHTNGEPDLEVSFLTRLPASGREKGFFGL